MLGIIRMIIVGLIVGALGRLIIPGAQHMGWIATCLLGIAGSFAAGLVLQLVNRRAGEPFHPAGFLASILGAAVLLFIAIKMGWFV
jgi:uncharacterized membrane protein YeaQ/YmgE (transglycosylase-associated protein family)